MLIERWTEQLHTAGDNIDHALDLLELMQNAIDKQQKSGFDQLQISVLWMCDFPFTNILCKWMP